MAMLLPLFQSMATITQAASRWLKFCMFTIAIIFRSYGNGTETWDYDEMTVTIKLKVGDKVWVNYHNVGGYAWENNYKYATYFTGLLLYRI